jgi:hypothetical protein
VGLIARKYRSADRLDADANQPRLLETDRVAVGQTQLFERCPLLACDLDVLPLVQADGAGGGRLIAVVVLRPAGRADEVRHGPLRAPILGTRDEIEPGRAEVVGSGTVE